MLTIVASVLHMGNISFRQGDMDNAELVDDRSRDALYTVAHLLQVSHDGLLLLLFHHNNRSRPSSVL